MTKEQLLRDAADDCESEANNLLNQAPSMGPMKEARYRALAEQCMRRALALRKWANELADEPNELLAAAKVALDEMCRTSAPRNSFTDAVDRLDTAISAAASSKEVPSLDRCQCGQYEWGEDYTRIESSLGTIHYKDQPCTGERTT
jgi:hypothetical protein